MSIQNVPEIFAKRNVDKLDLFVHDFKMTDDVFKSKVNLSLHMFSFLQKGKKQVHFADSSVAVNSFKLSVILLKLLKILYREYIRKLYTENLKNFLSKFYPEN